MSDILSSCLLEASARRDLHGAEDVASSSTPPSSAASSAETITTNDEDVRRCEEWDLFAELEQRTRPPTEQASRANTPDGPVSWPATTPKNQHHSTDSDSDSSDERELDGEDDSEKCEHQSDSCGSDDEPEMGDSGSTISPRDEELEAVAEDLQLSSPANRLPEVTALDTAAGTSLSDATRRNFLPSARSTLSAPSSTRETRLLPLAHPNRIQVYVRIRPPKRGELDVSALLPVEGTNKLCVQSVQAGAVTESTVDRVFTVESTQEDVYEAIDPGVQAALEGINATIFAYGQTGTGKTFTMFGDDIDTPFPTGDKTSRTPGEWGLIPRTMWKLCRASNLAESVDSHIQLSCSFMQIYNDRVFDLLTDRRRQKPLVLREQPAIDGGTSVVLQSLSSEPISSFTDAMQLVRRGRSNRSVRETELNATSSRSHAIVQINLSIETPLPSGNKRVRTSRLNLVDLAGSEKWNTDVEMEDHHAAELKNINTSLSALGNCIAALAETGRRHIPYRDSTLTRLLQDSFGGNALAFLIATVSPSQRSSEETIRTLQFADRARSVMQVVRVNESFSGSSELLAARAQIKTLRERLSQEQRRRHETRIKEHEALQRDFAAKLQEKDEELKRVQRDNEVFARWREEDVKRIRALEARIKEMEKGCEPTEEPATRETSVRAFPITHSMSSNQIMEEAAEKMSQQFDADSHSKTLARKKSNRAVKNLHGLSNTSHVVHEKAQKPKPRSYRSLIDKYSHTKKGVPADAQDESHASHAMPNSNHKLAPTGEHSIVQSTNSSLNDSSPQKRLDLRRSSSDTAFPPTIMSLAAPGHGANDMSITEKQDRTHGSSVFTSLVGSDRYPATCSHIASLWKTESLPSLGKSDSAKPYQSQPLYPDVSAASKDHIPTQAWQLPPVSSTASAELFSIARLEPNSSVINTQSVCAKHSLKGCVLCAVSDPQFTSTLPNTSSAFKASSIPPPQASMASSSPPAYADNRQPCERHQLPGCFICMKATGDSSWRSTASSFTPAAALNAAGSSFVPVSSSPGTRLSQDMKCPIHMLSNCVLCAGTTSSRPQPSQALPPSLESRFSSPIKCAVQPDVPVWRSNQLSEPNDVFTNGLAVSFSTSSDRNQELPRAQVVHQSMGSSSSPSTKDRFSNDSGSRRQFQVLVREASDAANVVLRRRA